MLGETISHYKILSELGRGGMGVVYRARDTKLGRDVALKFLPPGLTGDEESSRRFIREARAAAAIEHPNICSIFEIGESGGSTFIVMPCIGGSSLKDIVMSGPLDADRAVDIAVQACRGLTAAHDKGVIHRDIKPGNILLTEDGMVKIVDFGLAKLRGRSMLTKEGTTLGTVAYISPEQARGDEVDERSDIWSLGVVLYEMVTGRLPFPGEYDQAVIYSILNSEPKPLSSLRGGIPAKLERIIGKALSKDPGQRYPRMSDLLKELEAAARKSRTALVEDRADEKETSIAVLPFVNMSADPENEFFGDGLAEELINALTRLKGLRVVARTSAFSFKGKDTDIREIGRRLDVGNILEGSVRKSGDRLRVTVQLINVEDGYHIWSERFDREMEDIFVIQDEIARSVVNELEVKLAPRPGTELVKKYTDDLDAYTLYLKGLYNWNLMTPESWVLSRECLEEAVAIDPGFAPAYAGLAVWYQSQAYWGSTPPIEAYEKSMANARKALEIDEEMALVHDVLAGNYFLYDRNWPESEREFKRSLELDPTYSISRVNYGLHLILNGRLDEALEQPRIAKRYDPFSVIVNTWSAMILFYAGKVDEAVAMLHETIGMDPSHWQPHYHLANVYLDQSLLDEALAEAEKALELSGGASVTRMILAATDFVSGRTAEGDRHLGKLLDSAEKIFIPPTFFAWISMARGDPEEAYRHIKKAIEVRDAWLNFNRIAPRQLRVLGPEIDTLLRKTGWEK
jgi:serine/threonine protein kinase/tetratricopeptide (TPR) repeat protein